MSFLDTLLYRLGYVKIRNYGFVLTDDNRMVPLASMAMLPPALPSVWESNDGQQLPLQASPEPPPPPMMMEPAPMMPPPMQAQPPMPPQPPMQAQPPMPPPQPMQAQPPMPPPQPMQAQPPPAQPQVAQQVALPGMPPAGFAQSPQPAAAGTPQPEPADQPRPDEDEWEWKMALARARATSDAAATPAPAAPERPKRMPRATEPPPEPAVKRARAARPSGPPPGVGRRLRSAAARARRAPTNRPGLAARSPRRPAPRVARHDSTQVDHQPVHPNRLPPIDRTDVEVVRPVEHDTQVNTSAVAGPRAVRRRRVHDGTPLPRFTKRFASN